MNISALTFRDLQYLIALDTYRNFTKAAIACHVSQPALSTQIKKIEGYFGKTLFERQNTKIFPTAEGEKAIEIAKQVHSTAKQFQDLTHENNNFLCTHLTIGMILTLSPYYPPYFIPALKKTYPFLKISIVEGYTDYLMNELKEGHIDILIASDMPENSQFEISPIFEEPFLLCVNKLHPLSEKKSISKNDLDPLEMIFLKEGNCLRDAIVEICQKNTRGRIYEEDIPSLEILKNMIAFEKTYSVLPSLAKDIPLPLKDLICLKIFSDIKVPSRQIQMVWRKNCKRTKDFYCFFDLLKKNCPIFK